MVGWNTYYRSNRNPANPHWESGSRERLRRLCGISQHCFVNKPVPVLADEKDAAFPAIADKTQEPILAWKTPDNAEVFDSYSNTLCGYFRDDDYRVAEIGTKFILQKN